jgi:16S rRNA (uracil1498-N3)-methyltransferase
MGTPRFFVDQDLRPAAELALPAAVAHHALRVLRLRDGAPIVLFSGRGGEFDAVLRADGARATARLTGFRAVERESPLAVALLQSWVSADKLDWIVEKAVELGAERIVLWPAERSVVRLHGERRDKRMQHLRQLVIAACEQCGRNRLPALDAAGGLADALALARHGASLLLLPGATHTLAQWLSARAASPVAALSSAVSAAASRSAAIALVVGPEGGLSEAEVARARALGGTPVSLGPRVLRTETAGLAALAALQALAGDLRPAD